MGNMPACASRRSVGADRRVPVIAVVASLWAFTKLLRTPTEPVFLVYPAGLDGGVYHMSSP